LTPCSGRATCVLVGVMECALKAKLFDAGWNTHQIRGRCMYGWAGTLLWVDLSTGAVRREAADDSMRRLFLGGRGINTRLLYRLTSPDTQPLEPENILVFGSGPLGGTLAPSSPRCTVSAKSPLTGLLGDANFGGFFAPAMKKAGCDHIIIQGRAATPVYLYITEQDVAVRDASHLWGATIPDAEARLKNELADPLAQIALIGPAGENQVYTACVAHRYNVAGRTGMGAVMGSKNLKAVCVSGRRKPLVAHPELFAQERTAWLQKIRENPFTRYFGTYGSAGPLDKEDESGLLAVKNFSRTGGFQGVEKVSSAHLRKYFTRAHACFACPVHCIQSFDVTDGPYAGTRGTKMPEGCNSACGPSCGNSDPGSLFKLNNLANAYGLDILDFGLLMATAMDWYAHGIITDIETEGIPLDWGNHQSMVAMLGKIARREGFGSVLADGAVKAARHIGRDAEKFVSSCKGMIFGGVDPRVIRGSALCYATASRGADHLRGGILIELPGKNGEPALPLQEALEKYGTTDVLDPASYNKASAAVYNQDMYTIADCLEVCKFITAHNSYGITMDDMAAMLYAVTGLRLDPDQMRSTAQRVFTLERAYLVREGVTKADDALKGKWVATPVSGGRYSGSTIDPDKYERMLEDYYRARGWDARSGIPTRETLETLGLDDIAGDLQLRGFLQPPIS
jgi:aldehyde:ferredoxin oxidoreductase